MKLYELNKKLKEIDPNLYIADGGSRGLSIRLKDETSGWGIYNLTTVVSMVSFLAIYKSKARGNCTIGLWMKEQESFITLQRTT